MLRYLRSGLFWLLHLLLPVLGAALAFFGMAKASSSVAVLVGGGLVACAVVAWATSGLVLRTGSAVARARATAALASVALVAALGWVSLFRRTIHPTVAMPLRDAAFVQVPLSTGSQVAIARIAASTKDEVVKSPVVFLHGGPGGFVRSVDIALLQAIAARGIDAVAYDQAGAGASAKLNVREYSLKRAVADLEAVRVHLGAPRISLLGQSWGAMLAFEYASAHPDRVDRLVLTSAGLISSQNKTFAIERTAADRQPSPPPYVIATMLLMKLNADAALAFAPREELDNTWKAMLRDNLGRFYCKSDASRVPEGQADLERWPAVDSYQGVALKGEMEARGEAPPMLATPPPSLMIRGMCDFVPWGAARDLRDRTKATLVLLPDVGHAVWPKRADHVSDLVVAHLRGAPLPITGYAGTDEPAVASAD